MTPLFMWAGGKTKLLEHYAPFLPESFDSYHEPFFGGGAMFTWAYEKNPDANFFINDINEHIIGIYQAIRDDLPTFTATIGTRFTRRKKQEEVSSLRFVSLIRKAIKTGIHRLKQESFIS